jgi:hypothetical protein
MDTMAVVSHKVQQKALMRQACSIGYSASKRRPTHLTAEQSASINDDPKIQDLLRQRDLLLSKGNKSDKVRTRLRKNTKDIQSEKARLRRKRKEQVRKAWTREQAVTDIERQLAGPYRNLRPPLPACSSRSTFLVYLFELISTFCIALPFCTCDEC